MRLLRVLQQREIERVGGTERIPVEIRVIAATNKDLGRMVQEGSEPPRLADNAIDDLTAYDWPGNVRELDNVLERAMILHRGEPLSFENLGPATASPEPPSVVADAQPLELDAVVSQHIRRVLKMTGGKIHGPGGAGEVLAVNPNTLRYKMRKLGIPFRRETTRGDG